MALQQQKLVDGIRFHHYETKRFKSNYLCVNFLTPLDQKTVAENALIPEILSKGTEHYPTIADLSNRLNDLYGTSLTVGSEKRGDNQCLYFSFDMLRNEFAPDGSDLLSEVLNMVEELFFHPYLENGIFSEKAVETEKEKRIAEIESLIGNKRAYAAVRLIDEMCKEERYSIRNSGSVEAVKAITADSLYRRFQSLLSTAQIEIFFVGTCDDEKTVTQLQQIFSCQKRDPVFTVSCEIIPCANEIKKICEKQPAMQSNLQIGFRGVPPRKDLKKSAAFSVFCDLFGGSPTSKLFMNVREKLSLCYFCRAGAISEKGIMTVQAGIAAENRELAEAEILRQWEHCKAGEISQEELSMAKQSLTNAYRTLQDRPASLERYYLNALIADNPHDFSDYIPAITAVTKEEVMEAANALTVDTIYFLMGVSE